MSIRTRLVRRLGPAGVAAATWAATAARGASVVTNFNDGTAQGWSLIGLPSPVSGASWTNPKTYGITITTTGGSDGGGYVSGTDTTSDALYFVAAPAFLGNRTSFIDGTLSFAVRNTPGDNTNAIAANDASVILVNKASTKALYQSVTPTTVTTTFSTLNYKLGTGGGWKVNGKGGADAGAADFTDVLGDLGAAYVLADYRAGNNETTAIDDVQMTSAPSGAPEPASAALVALVASALLGRRPRFTPPSLACSHGGAKS